jgi:hypothetical protein
MSKSKKTTAKKAPVRPTRQSRLAAMQWTPLVRNSYVLSRFWAWCSRIQLSPTVRIPVPRFLSYRDP